MSTVTPINCETKLSGGVCVGGGGGGGGEGEYSLSSYVSSVNHVSVPTVMSGL